MISVIFVCLGNICRSPTAELVFKKLVAEEGLSLSFRVDSFGTSDCEEGNPIYPPSARTLVARGVEGGHIAKQLSLRDVINSDYILVMDSENLMDVLRLTGGKFGEKIYKLGSFTAHAQDIADPWYTRNFELAFDQIEEGCRAFLEYIKREKGAALDYDAKH